MVAVDVVNVGVRPLAWWRPKTTCCVSVEWVVLPAAGTTRHSPQAIGALRTAVVFTCARVRADPGAGGRAGRVDRRRPHQVDATGRRSPRRPA